MTPYCIDCVHRWQNTDGINMCGRPSDAPRFCFVERSDTPQPDRDACGPRGKYFERKP
ncbi:MAG: hypothetical protein VW713_04590 [Alphaproteobacteria bacterium]